MEKRSGSCRLVPPRGIVLVDETDVGIATTQGKGVAWQNLGYTNNVLANQGQELREAGRSY